MVARGVALTAMVLFSVLLHELGHALAGARNGLPVKGSILLPLGGVALADPAVHDPARMAQEVRVAAAGPLVNAFLAGVSGIAIINMAPVSYLWA